MANETWAVSPVSLLSGGRKSPSVTLVSLFFLPQKLHVPDGAHARASQTTDVCRLWWVCVYVCICVCVCVCVCRYVCVIFGGHFIQQQSRVSSEGYKGERRLEKKTESVMWSRYFPGSPLPSVSSSQASPSGLTLLPLLGLVVSQSPFLIDQQLDLSPV